MCIMIVKIFIFTKSFLIITLFLMRLKIYLIK